MKILIIEDCIDYSGMFRKTLEYIGISEVATATTTGNVVTLLERDRFNLVFIACDMVMEIDLIELARKTQPDANIIVVSNHDEDYLRDSLDFKTIDGYLSKFGDFIKNLRIVLMKNSPVLIVDDNVGVCDGLMFGLDEDGFRDIRKAESCVEALRMIGERTDFSWLIINMDIIPPSQPRWGVSGIINEFKRTQAQWAQVTLILNANVHGIVLQGPGMIEELKEQLAEFKLPPIEAGDPAADEPAAILA